MFKKFGILGVFALMAACLAGFYMVWVFPTHAIQVSGPIIFEIPKGAGAKKISQVLEQSGMGVDADQLNIWLRIGQKFKKVKAGTYRFAESTSIQGVYEKIKNGEVYRPLALKFNIPEGSNSKVIFAKLVSDGVGTHGTFDRLFKNSEFIKSLNISGNSLEGYLYPATYYFYDKLPSPENAIRRFVQEFHKRIHSGLKNQITGKGLSLEKAITFASLIEKETLTPDERPKISEVIWNRLGKGEPLGIDAAIIYGIKNYQGDITWKHLKDKTNPYNTRVHKGLPPTPISSPTVASIEAVLNPTDRGYYYFVRVPGKEKRHHFSKTYREHAKYVDKWVKATTR